MINLINYPNNSVIIAGELLNFSIDDSSLVILIYHWDSDPNQILNFSFLITIPEREGIHYLFVYAIDEANNSASIIYKFNIEIRSDQIPSFEWTIILISILIYVFHKRRRFIG